MVGGVRMDKTLMGLYQEVLMSLPFDLAKLNIPPSSEIHKLLEKCPDIRMMLFEDGEFIVREKDLAMDTYIVLRGNYVVEQARADPKKESPDTLDIVMVDEGSIAFVGEMAYFGGGFRTASVRSSGRTYTLCLKPEYMDIIISEMPFFTSILCRQFTKRLMEANRLLRQWDERFSIKSKLVLKNPGETVLEKGERAETLYQLVEGILVREEDNETISLDQTCDGFIDPGPFFLDGEYESTVKTKSMTCVVAIQKDSKLNVISNFPGLILKLYQREAT